MKKYGIYLFSGIMTVQIIICSSIDDIRASMRQREKLRKELEVFVGNKEQMFLDKIQLFLKELDFSSVAYAYELLAEKKRSENDMRMYLNYAVKAIDNYFIANDFEETSRMFRLVISLYANNSIAKFFIDFPKFAQMAAEKLPEERDKIHFYELAAQLYKQGNQFADAAVMHLTLADYLAKKSNSTIAENQFILNNYIIASDLYEQAFKDFPQKKDSNFLLVTSHIKRKIEELENKLWKQKEEKKFKQELTARRSFELSKVSMDKQAKQQEEQENIKNALSRQSEVEFRAFADSYARNGKYFFTGYAYEKLADQKRQESLSNKSNPANKALYIKYMKECLNYTMKSIDNYILARDFKKASRMYYSFFGVCAENPEVKQAMHKDINLAEFAQIAAEKLPNKEDKEFFYALAAKLYENYKRFLDAAQMHLSLAEYLQRSLVYKESVLENFSKAIEYYKKDPRYEKKNPMILQHIENIERKIAEKQK